MPSSVAPLADAEIIEKLNEVLTAELTAINQYFLHGKMQSNWGYKKLAKYIKLESIDEMRHAEALIERILFLESIPNLKEMFPLRIDRIDIDRGEILLASGPAKNAAELWI